MSDWLLGLTAVGAAENTLKSKAESLAQWWRWCTDQGVDPLKTGAVEFAKFVLALQTIPVDYPLTSPVRALPGDDRLRDASTVRLRVVHIKTFYAWAALNGRCSSATSNAISGFKTPRAPKSQTAGRLLPEQVRVLLGADYHPRDRWLVEVIYGCGLREGEAVGLQIGDLCLNAEIATIFGCDVPRGSGPHLHVRRRPNRNGARAKSLTDRVLPLPRRTLVALRNWQSWAYENAPETLECPFVAISLAGPTRGQALSVKGFLSMWASKVQCVEGLGHVNPHLLRHTFASELMDAGVEHFTVQTLLGHESPESTRVYAHSLMQTLTDAVDRLARWRESEMGLAS